MGNGPGWVVGGTKSTSDLSKPPVIAARSANLLLTFQRAQASTHGSTTVVIQLRNDLSTRPASYKVPGPAQAANAVVTILEDSFAGSDTVTHTVARGREAKKFACIEVTSGTLIPQNLTSRNRSPLPRPAFHVTHSRHMTKTLKFGTV